MTDAADEPHAAAGPARRGPAFETFALLGGGPYHDLRVQLARLHASAATAPARAALLAGICWGVPLLLSLAGGDAWGPPEAHPYLLDPSPWARFLLLVVAFTLAERMVDARLDDIVERFTDSPLVARRDMPAMAARLAEALRRRDSRLAEGVTLVVALALGIVSLASANPPPGGAWYAHPLAEGGGRTAAGVWAGLVSVTIFAFLVLRWLRAIVIWGLLLRRVAQLELRLSLFHPDGYGGLGFLGRYPNVFALHVFAISCVLGAALMRQVMAGSAEPTVFAAVMGAWLAVVLALFGLPLLAFVPPLAALKKSAMEAASAIATHHGREAERAVLGDNCAAPGAADEVDGAPDPGKLYGAAKKLGTLPFARAALVPIGAAALLPLVAAGAAELPLKEVFTVAKKLLLL